MTGILLAKIRLTLRNPWALIILTVLCIVFAFFMSIGAYSKIQIPVASSLSEEETFKMIGDLNQSELFTFIPTEESDMRDDVQKGNNEAGVLLEETEYVLYVAAHSSNIALLQQFVTETYHRKVQRDELVGTLPEEEKHLANSIWEKSTAQPLFTVSKESFRSAEARVIDMPLQTLFGFSLFFVIYTISFNIVTILDEKQNLIWDRMIVSPVRKWEMYAGNLLYSFLIGYGQIALIFLTFRYGAGVNFHGGFGKTLFVLIPYVLTIVALCMLLAGITKSIRQYNALIPILSVVLAMLGGAYWPIEIVTSEIMVYLSKFSPVYYGMEALKGATLYGSSVVELLQPISILLLIAVIMMGVGINAMEMRKK